MRAAVSPSGSGASAVAKLRRSTSGAANLRKQQEVGKAFDNGETVLRLREGERWIARLKEGSVDTPRGVKRHLELSPLDSSLSNSGNSAPPGLLLPLTASLSTSSSTGSGSCASSGSSSPRTPQGTPGMAPNTPATFSSSGSVSNACSSPTARLSGRRVSFCGLGSAPAPLRRPVSAEPPKIRIVQTPNVKLDILKSKIQSAVRT